MGTRGTYGFKINKEIKVIMTHYDANPGRLGEDIIKFLQSVDLKRLKTKVEKLQAIPEELIKENPLAKKEIWKKPEQVLKAIYTGTLQSYFDAQEFLLDPLFCEYSYLINLDTQELECYESGTYLSLGKYPLADIDTSIVQKMNKFKNKNAAAKAELLGYPHYGPKKKKQK